MKALHTVFICVCIRACSFFFAYSDARNAKCKHVCKNPELVAHIGSSQTCRNLRHIILVTATLLHPMSYLPLYENTLFFFQFFILGLMVTSIHKFVCHFSLANEAEKYKKKEHKSQSQTTKKKIDFFPFFCFFVAQTKKRIVLYLQTKIL